jgi:hypothetical protein
MANPWCRLYSEFANDPKVQMMSEAMQRRLAMLFCFRCNESLLTATDSQLAFTLRISLTELAETKLLFMANGFIDEHWQLANWQKRQPLSDHTAAARVRKHREKMRHEAGLFDALDDVKRYSNTTEQNRVEQNRTTARAARSGSKAKPNPALGMAVASTEERAAKERREQLATWRYARDHGTKLWKSAEPWIISALDAEDAMVKENSSSVATSV